MRKVVKILAPFVVCIMAVMLCITPVNAAYYDFNWDFSTPKQEEYNSLVDKGYKEVSLKDAEKLGRQYYEKRSRDTGELKIFCEGALSSELENLYTKPVNCFDSYSEASVSPYIEYHKGVYYSSYCFGTEFSNFRQGEMTDIQYDMAMGKAKELAEQFNYGTNKDKIKRTYKWICDNMEYDDTLTKGSIYDAFILGDTVCTGYATSFQVVMEAMGIECYLCTGYVDGENHAWNAVNLDGVYYFVDPTFGDTSGNLDKWLLFGTDRRINETYLNITASSDYSDSEEAMNIMVGFLVIIIVPLIILIVIIVIICVTVSSNRKNRAAAYNPSYGVYMNNPYGVNNYGGNYGGQQYSNVQYNAGQYGNPQYGGNAQYNNGQYSGMQYGSIQYGSAGQYGNTQYGSTVQYGNSQYPGQQFSNGQYNSGYYQGTQYGGAGQYGSTNYSGASQYGNSQYSQGASVNQFNSSSSVTTGSTVANEVADMSYVNPYIDKLDTVDMNYANPYINQDTSDGVNTSDVVNLSKEDNKFNNN